jgi:hypothetical protein
MALVLWGMMKWRWGMFGIWKTCFDKDDGVRVLGDLTGTGLLTRVHCKMLYTASGIYMHDGCEENNEEGGRVG